MALGADAMNENNMDAVELLIGQHRALENLLQKSLNHQGEPREPVVNETVSAAPPK